MLEGEDLSDHKNESKEHKGEEEETCEDREKAGFFEPVIYSGMNCWFMVMLQRLKQMNYLPHIP